MTTCKPFRRPPAGVLAGESIPVENDRQDLEESRLEEVMNALKARGEPYTSMSESELEDRAIDTLSKYNHE